MNSHTPQEWADWTGCYVAQDKRGSFYMFPDKPDMCADGGLWRSDLFVCIPEGLVDIPSDHHWTTLYEPRKADSAPHQSEVFIHKEYKVICADNQKELQDRVTLALYEGWNPQGGVFIQDRSNTARVEFAFFYQAMVRGV